MRRVIFRLVRSASIGHLVRWIFATMSWTIPVKRLHETKSLMAFHHPVPAYTVHILIVPKHPYKNLLDVPPDSDFQRELFTTVQHLIIHQQLTANYRLICNGGANQTVPYLL